MKAPIFSLTLHETPESYSLFDSLIQTYAPRLGLQSIVEIEGLIFSLSRVFQYLISESIWYHETPTVHVEAFLASDEFLIEFSDKALPWRQSQLRQDLKTAVFKNESTGIERVEAFNLGKNGRLLKIQIPINPNTNTKSDEVSEDQVDHAITFRQLSPSESDKAVDCMVVAYGYDYGIPDVYDVEQTRKLMEEKLVHTLAAETDSKQIAGISTLRKRHATSQIADLCQTMVNPKFMQKKLFENLLSGVIDIAENELGCQGLSATIPNKHYVSQKKLERLGFIPSGILIGCVPAIVMPKQIGTHLGDRESFLMVYKPMQPIPFDTLYVPERHSDVLQTICNQIRYYPTFSPLPFIDLPNKTTPSSQLILHEVENLNWAIIEIQSCGSDIVDRLLDTLESLKLRQFRAIQLYLDLSDPIAVSYLDSLESMGFFFAGFFPDEKPYLVLQFLHNMAFRFEDLDLPMSGAHVIQQHIESAFGRKQQIRHAQILNKEGQLLPQL